ncbi:hypothetical protein [Desulfovibrio sp. Huiquan2017]|uniref:hypothetical protein n=1 Tax=Desulfovibrio sp. Huiquan2017 TaxID=2816861 RepID=UPI001A927990|nr:hypothetical protein [Desulfovibrio sp. Huiquan2017]
MNAPLDKTLAPACDSFDPLDMRNYSLEKLPTLPAGPIMQMVKKVGVPLAILFFCIFHFQMFEIESFATQTKVPAASCYTMLGIFESVISPDNASSATLALNSAEKRLLLDIV